MISSHKVKIRALVVDDTIFYRKIVAELLDEFPEIEVVGKAANGQIAVSRIKSLQPDLVTLDVEMPVKNGLEVLNEVQDLGIDTDFVMVSSKTQQGSAITMEALQAGAFDFIAKPDTDSIEKNKTYLKKELARILQVYNRKKQIKKILGGSLIKEERPKQVITKIPRQKALRTEKSVAVAIGISTGGPNALAQMIPQLPDKIGVPILLVQHMPPMFTASLAKSLDSKSKIMVKEAVDGETIYPDIVYIAPGGSQMKVATGAQLKKIIRITNDPPENNCKPAVDYLFRSVAREYGSKATGVIMTGMGSDGKLGLTVMKSAGAVSISQSAETCVVYGMPKAVEEANLSDVVAPLDKIHAEIIKTLR